MNTDGCPIKIVIHNFVKVSDERFIKDLKKLIYVIVVTIFGKFKFSRNVNDIKDFCHELSICKMHS